MDEDDDSGPEQLVLLDNARDPHQREAMRKTQEAGICAFCREHIEKNHKNPIIRETKHWYCTKNDYPYEHSVHHLLFIAQRHVSNNSDLTPEEITDLHRFAAEISEELGIKGATLMLRHGDMRLTGATILHLHAHLISGNGTDPVITRVG